MKMKMKFRFLVSSSSFWVDQGKKSIWFAANEPYHFTAYKKCIEINPGMMNDSFVNWMWYAPPTTSYFIGYNYFLSDPSPIILPCLVSPCVSHSVLSLWLDWCDPGVWRFTQPLIALRAIVSFDLIKVMLLMPGSIFMFFKSCWC